MLAHVTSATVVGIEASPIDVEVDVGAGLPGCNIVGLPDAGVKEGRIRIRGALENCGARMPQRRVTVNLAPADLRKDGAAFDVPIAVGILAANGDVPEGAARDAVMLGELALDGAVRPVRGVLPIAAWARAAGKRRLFVPAANAAEAAVAAQGLELHAVAHLQELVALLRGEPGPVSGDGTRPIGARSEAWAASGSVAVPATSPVAGPGDGFGVPDLADIRGQEVARRALEIAAAGGHNLLFVGPPGSGKTMLARRLPGILPALSLAEALESTMVYSVAGLLGDRPLLAQRPFRAPHHTVSVPGLAGGGSLVRPGEISLANNGVLFLDELLEFSRPALEILRQPLEERSIAIVRARRSVTFPADFMLVAATNPCPCGHLGNRVRTCTCSLAAIAAYRGRLSGPLLDRIDMHVEVPALGYQELSAREPGEPSAMVRERVERARGLALARGPRTNGRLGKRELDEHAAVDGAGHRLLERAVERLGLSARALDRVRRVARTIADLEGAAAVAGAHVAEALQYRVLDRPVE